jgi:hypothetical protein
MFGILDQDRGCALGPSPVLGFSFAPASHSLDSDALQFRQARFQSALSRRSKFSARRFL